MKAVATMPTSSYLRPSAVYRPALEIARPEKLHFIKTRETIQKIISVTATIIVTIMALSLFSYAVIKYNENRIAASYITEAYKIVINPAAI